MTCEKCSRTTALSFCPWCDPITRPVRKGGRKKIEAPRGILFERYNGNSATNRRKRAKEKTVCQ